MVLPVVIPPFAKRKQLQTLKTCTMFVLELCTHIYIRSKHLYQEFQPYKEAGKTE